MTSPENRLKKGQDKNTLSPDEPTVQCERCRLNTGVGVKTKQKKKSKKRGMRERGDENSHAGGLTGSIVGNWVVQGHPSSLEAARARPRPRPRSDKLTGVFKALRVSLGSFLPRTERWTGNGRFAPYVAAAANGIVKEGTLWMASVPILFLFSPINAAAAVTSTERRIATGDCSCRASSPDSFPNSLSLISRTSSPPPPK